ncbi:hypothetical protein VTO42DRAFT_4486 [Malbranchea cinnamomea]
MMDISIFATQKPLPPFTGYSPSQRCSTVSTESLFIMIVGRDRARYLPNGGMRAMCSCALELRNSARFAS